MGHTVFRAPTRQEIRRDETMHLEYEDVITCYREDDHVLAEMLGITGDLEAAVATAKIFARPGSCTSTTRHSTSRARTRSR